MHFVHILCCPPSRSISSKAQGKKVINRKMLLFAATLALLCLAAANAEEVYIEENNSYELDQDSFWKIAHKIDKHVIIEMYTSATWCGKFNHFFSELFQNKIRFNFLYYFTSSLSYVASRVS